MAESTQNPADFGIPETDADGELTGVYLYLDTVTKNGIAKIITYWNIQEETRTNEFDNTQYTMWAFNSAWIKSWSLPGFYLKDGILTQIGTVDSEGYRVITRAEAEDYIRANAAEIAGFAQVTKSKFIN